MSVGLLFLACLPPFFAAPSHGKSSGTIVDQAVSVPDQITTELLRVNDDPIGRPLPVAAHWNTGRPSTPVPGWDPDFVLDYLDSGEYVIPTFTIRMPIETPEIWSHYQSGLARASQLGIPIALRFTQWDRLFTDDPTYAGLPPSDNPNVIDAIDGKTILPMSDPDGPIVVAAARGRGGGWESWSWSGRLSVGCWPAETRSCRRPRPRSGRP